MAKKAKGALGTEPKTATATKNQAAAPNLTRVSPGMYRNPEGQLVNVRGQRIDSRGRRVSVGGGKQTKPGQEGLPGAPTGSAEESFRRLNPEQQNREMYEDAGAFYNQVMSNAMRFDPNNPAAGYQQGFTNQLDAARQNVMDQFERTMAPQFQREQAAFQQQMAEQGIDPNSEGYQARYKAMMDSQNAQRLNAQSQAFQLGSGYQQQGFEQAVAGQMLPFQQLGVAQEPWKLQYASQQEAIQREKDRQAAALQARIGAGASIRSAQISADASMHRANLDAINQGYPTNRKPSLGTEITRGAVTGITSGMVR